MNSGISSPGLAQLRPCPDCQGKIGQQCYECRGRGVILMRACPACGNAGWDYANGIDDRDGMTCTSGCGHRWTASDPAWLAQTLAAE